VPASTPPPERNPGVTQRRVLGGGGKGQKALETIWFRSRTNNNGTLNLVINFYSFTDYPVISVETI